MAETTKALSTLSSELPEQMSVMLRKLTLNQWHNAFRQALTRTEVEDMIDNLVLLAVSEIWRRMQQEGKNNAS